MTDEPTMAIGELARRAGLATSAIRFYERRGLLPAPPRVSGRRRYADDALTRLRVIALARRSGFTLAETRSLLGAHGAGNPPGEAWAHRAAVKLSELEARIEDLRAMQELLRAAAACRCADAASCELLRQA